MICKDGSDWQPTAEQELQWQDAYPDVDIYQELKRMAAWLSNNESKRKTKRGMPRFCNAWLSRANDQGGSPTQYQTKEEAQGIVPLRQWTQVDDITHDFLNDDKFKADCLAVFGQYMSKKGERVTNV